MAEWLSYTPADFLMFSDRTYWRLFELENAALMPLPVVLPLAVTAAILLAWLRPKLGMPALAAVLAVGWGLAGWSFAWQRYAAINWAVAYLVPFFLVEALLVLAAATGDRTGARERIALVRAGGYLLLVYAAALHPFLAVVGGRPFAGAEIVGIAPDPTAIATLGFGLLLNSARLRALVLVFPALWLALSALTLWLLGAAHSAVPLLALLVTAGVLIVGRWWR